MLIPITVLPTIFTGWLAAIVFRVIYCLNLNYQVRSPYGKNYKD
jgi:hypothetical protein